VEKINKNGTVTKEVMQSKDIPQ